MQREALTAPDGTHPRASPSNGFITRSNTTPRPGTAPFEAAALEQEIWFGLDGEEDELLLDIKAPPMSIEPKAAGLGSTRRVGALCRLISVHIKCSCDTSVRLLDVE